MTTKDQLTEKKIRISLSKEELWYLQHILYHFSDYMAYDDRPDHGFGILEGYRDLPEKDKRIVFMLAGKLRRIQRKQQKKQITTDSMRTGEIKHTEK